MPSIAQSQALSADSIHIRTMRSAAEKFDAIARDLLQCSNVKGTWHDPQWTDEADAKAEYEDLTKMAMQLRRSAEELIVGAAPI